MILELYYHHGLTSISPISQGQSEGGYYNCDDLPFFEIGSAHHEMYLVNVRLPGHRAQNRGIGQVSGLEFVVSMVGFLC